MDAGLRMAMNGVWVQITQPFCVASPAFRLHLASWFYVFLCVGMLLKLVIDKKICCRYHNDLQSFVLAHEPAGRAVCGGRVPSPRTNTQTMECNLLDQYATLWLNTISFSIHKDELFHAFLYTIHFWSRFRFHAVLFSSKCFG